MSMELLTMIMSSTVISIIISSILSFIQNRKNSNLQYITLERKDWREHIRCIAEEISLSSSDNISITLDKLKVRINAYGSSKVVNIFQDSHIWNLIKITKKVASVSPEDFPKCKDLLIDTISLLLKHDWDRSKWEVKGDVYFILEKFSLLIFWSVTVFAMIYSLGYKNVIGLIYFFLLILFFFNVYNKISIDSKNFLKNNKFININSHKKYNVLLSIFILLISVYLESETGFPFKPFQNYSLNFLLGSIDYFIIIMLPYVFWYRIWTNRFIHELNSNNDYIRVVEEIIDQMLIIQSACDNKKNN